MKTISKIDALNAIEITITQRFLGDSEYREENLLHIYVELVNTSLDHMEDSQCRREKL